MPEIMPGDIVTLRKPHPCGGTEWDVTRTGADIGLRCRKCGGKVMIERSALLKRMKSVRLGADEHEQSG